MTTPLLIGQSQSRPDCAEENVVEELKTYWQNVPPEIQALIPDVGVALVALVCGHYLGVAVGNVLRHWNFDAVLRPPTVTPPTSPLVPAPAPERRFTPTVVLGLLVRLTVWAGAAWWLANKHGQVDLAATLSLVIRRTWALATVVVAALALGSVLAHRLFECLQHLPKTGADPQASRNGIAAPAAASPFRGLAGAVAAGAYVGAVLLVLLVGADLFEWPLTRTAAQGLWQFAQHVLAAGAALFLGHLGARWARDLVANEAAGSAEKRAGQYTALGIVAGTTVLAVAVLLSSAGLLLALASLGVLGLVLWMARGYLPDVTAGWQLRSHKSAEVWFEGTAWRVSEVGWITTQLGRAGEYCRVPNRQVLDALLRGAPPEAAVR
jgi:hypothetical protein